MAKAGRVYHWKHGWIPLDAYARDIVARRGKDRSLNTGQIKPPADALKRAKERQAAFKAKQAAKPTADDVHSQQSGSYRLTTVDGYPHVYFKEVLELDPRPPEQYREVAKVVTDTMKPYPKATKNNPIEVGWSGELETSVMADTNIKPNHRIRLQPNMWDKPLMTTAQMHQMAASHFGLTAQASSLEEFRRNVIIHELGHVLNMKEQDKHREDDGPLDQIAFEWITPAELGYTDVDPPQDGPYTLTKKTKRWRIDSLKGKSAYAISDPYEFVAEAFLDGTINGGKASESGKRVVARAQMEFS